eukprot:scaffold79109_cov47-Attheya_sp.AAC.3
MIQSFGLLQHWSSSLKLEHCYELGSYQAEGTSSCEPKSQYHGGIELRIFFRTEHRIDEAGPRTPDAPRENAGRFVAVRYVVVVARGSGRAATMTMEKKRHTKRMTVNRIDYSAAGI